MNLFIAGFNERKSNEKHIKNNSNIANIYNDIHFIKHAIPA